VPSPNERITAFLRGSGKPIIQMTFKQLESIREQALPDSARKHHAYWAKTQNFARCWKAAGYLISNLNLRGETFCFVSQPGGEEASVQQRIRRPRWSGDKLLVELDIEFDRSIAAFAEQRIFTGPSLHFYERSVRMVRDTHSFSDLVEQDLFYDLVYATLTSWGMHRMGRRVTAKLTEFPTFRATVREFLRGNEDLRGVSICDLEDAEVSAITKRLAIAVETPRITASGAPLVANTKTLHFLLPDLVPPMDRRYTCRSFYGSTQPQGGAAEVFSAIFPHLQALARRHKDAVRNAIGSYLALGEAKVLDNAIVGFVLNHPERFGVRKAQ
jgi:hypothetical protein